MFVLNLSIVHLRCILNSSMFNKIYNMFLEMVDKLLQYRLFHMLSFSNEIANIASDLHKINLLSQNELNVVKSTNGQIHSLTMMVIMVSDNIINGDKNDFSKLSTYLKTLPERKRLVQYLDRKSMLSLVDTKMTFQIYKLPQSKKTVVC